MAAYYNEIDPFAAQWLRNLIAAGHIAPGDVDERSIVDVRPDDLRCYTQCHFFAGIAGWSYALRLVGWEDERPVWTGSCPCQPLSSAGQRKGHADERHLWPAFYRLIAECRPAVIFGEQVASKDGREWFAGIRADLEATIYAVGAANLPAAGVRAPHPAGDGGAVSRDDLSVATEALLDAMHADGEEKGFVGPFPRDQYRPTVAKYAGAVLAALRAPQPSDEARDLALLKQGAEKGIMMCKLAVGSIDQLERGDGELADYKWKIYDRLCELEGGL